jgi:O-antigen ligase
MALNSYLNGSMINYILGQGFGTLIDMQVFMLLGDETLEYIPILHNGYLYLLIKTGLIGLLLYLIYLFGFLKTGWRYSRSQEGVLALTGHYIVACTLVLFFTTFVISGMFNKDGLIPIMLFLGTLLSYGSVESNKALG